MRTFKNIVGATLLLFVLKTMVSAQVIESIPIKSAITINDTLTGDYSFTQYWDYPFPIYMDEKSGKLINGLDDRIRVKKKDVEKLYYTANCTTNHQGEHLIRYCDATLKGDTLLLAFSDCDAAYHGWLQIIVVRDSFQGQWYCDYVYYHPEQVNYFAITMQELILNTKEFEIGTAIQGKITIIFNEYNYAPGYGLQNEAYYVKGLLKTNIK